jgi:hypothetical protein
MSWLRRFLCSHVCSQKQMHREEDGMVAATCLKCGKVLRADFGLALPCTWENQCAVRRNPPLKRQRK